MQAVKEFLSNKGIVNESAYIPCMWGNFKDKSGRPKNVVYFLLSEDEEILYIGITKCIQRRLAEHVKSGKAFEYVYGIFCKNRDELRRMEKKAIKHFTPPLNNEWKRKELKQAA